MKEETIEEAAERYADIRAEIFDLTKSSQLPHYHNDRNKIEDAVEFGAKWQAERMYSDAIEFAKWMYDYKADINKVKELFEQFKKK